jgi:hypothetical protein
VVLILTAEAFSQGGDWRTALKESAVLVVSLLAFASEPDDVRYLSRRLCDVAFGQVCSRSSRIIDFVRSTRKLITIDSAGGQLVADLGSEVWAMTPKLDPMIAPGECVSIIQFLEVALQPEQKSGTVVVRGQFQCDGVVVAEHLNAQSNAAPPASGAWKLFEELRAAGRFPLLLTFESSQVVSILTRDGAEIVDLVLPLTDGDTSRNDLTEVAFASWEPSEEANWAMNSQLNEPAGGIHLGIGSRSSRVHIDFISPRATARHLLMTDDAQVEGVQGDRVRLIYA